MVCNGPDPPDHDVQEISPRPRHELDETAGDDDSEDELDYLEYEQLPQAPDTMYSDHEYGEEEEEIDENQPTYPPYPDTPPGERMDSRLNRELWNSPRVTDPIQMDNERAEQVMSAMANFALPQASIPDWAQSISEEQWKQTLTDRIEKIKDNA